MKLFLCVWLSFSFCGSSFAAWNHLTFDGYRNAVVAFEALDYSVAFMLTVNNYANQTLAVSQSIIKSGKAVSDAPDIGPGMIETMSTRKRSMTATGTHGVVSWTIGSTGKMLVVMYDVPYSFWYSNMIAVGIFPQGDITGHYNMMYYGAEDGGNFTRKSATVGRPLRHKLDPDYYIEADIAEVSKAGAYVSLYPKHENNLAIPNVVHDDGYDSFADFHLAVADM